MKLQRMSLIIATLLFAMAMPKLSAAKDNPQDLFSHGSGPIEVLMFTDYYCPPCRSIEPYLETALENLHRLGVKITFVDKPIHSITPIFSKYFLYASKVAHNFGEVLKARSALFAIADGDTIHSERDLLQRIKEKEIPYALMDPAPIFNQWSQIIEQFEVRSTPTCIVLKPDRPQIKYVGSRQIPQGIDLLLKELSQGTTAQDKNKKEY